MSDDRPVIVIDRDVAMTTRDGVRLAADVYRSDDDARHPVLLHRTAYGKQTAAMIAELIADPAVLAAHGYAVVVQDVRGRFASAGEWVPFVHEADDGYDTVEWAGVQPWSTGRVGVYGSSYMGITAYQAVRADPPHLAAAATVVSGCDLNDGLARTGGAYELGFVSLWAVSTALGDLGRAPAGRRAELGAIAAAAGADPWAVVRALPLRDAAPVQLTDWLTDWLDHEPGDAWYEPTTLAAADVRVPLLQVVGARDWMQRSMLRLFRELPVDARSELLLGPWTHRSAYGGDSGLRDWSAAAPGGPAGHTPRLLDWFDRHLRDATDDRPARVRWFATGDEVWRSADTWPPPGAGVTRYLGADGVLATSAGDGWTELAYDPDDPVPTCGGMIAMPPFGPDGVQDRSAVEARGDVRTWTGPELTEPLRIVGDVRVELTITADAPDADLVAVLVDVTPAGVAEPVTEGVQRLRYRAGGTDDWLEPGVPTEVVVHLADTAHTVLPGHRLRLELAASNYPRFSRSSGSVEVPEHAAQLHPVQLRIAHLSRLVLHTT